ARGFDQANIIDRTVTSQLPIPGPAVLGGARLATRINQDAAGGNWRSNAAQQKPAAELQEGRGINVAVAVEIEHVVVRHASQQQVGEAKEVGGVGVAVAIYVAKEAEDVGRRIRRCGRGQNKIVAGGPVAVAIQLFAVGVRDRAGEYVEHISAVLQRPELT